MLVWGPGALGNSWRNEDMGTIGGTGNGLCTWGNPFFPRQSGLYHRRKGGRGRLKKLDDSQAACHKSRGKRMASLPPQALAWGDGSAQVASSQP